MLKITNAAQDHLPTQMWISTPKIPQFHFKVAKIEKRRSTEKACQKKMVFTALKIHVCVEISNNNRSTETHLPTQS